MIMIMPNETTFSSSELVLKPLKYELWGLHIGMMVITGTILWIVAKLSANLQAYRARTPPFTSSSFLGWFNRKSTGSFGNNPPFFSNNNNNTRLRKGGKQSALIQVVSVTGDNNTKVSCDNFQINSELSEKQLKPAPTSAWVTCNMTSNNQKECSMGNKQSPRRKLNDNRKLTLLEMWNISMLNIFGAAVSQGKCLNKILTEYQSRKMNELVQLKNIV